MTGFDYTILAALALAVAASVIHIVRQSRKGCSGGCSGCTRSCTQRQKEDKNNESHGGK